MSTETKWELLKQNNCCPDCGSDLEWKDVRSEFPELKNVDADTHGFVCTAAYAGCEFVSYNPADAAPHFIDTTSDVANVAE